MHKRLERIVIVAALLIAAGYALLSFWPGETPPTSSPEVVAHNPEQQTVDPTLDPKSVEAEVVANLVKIGSCELSFYALTKRFGTIEELVHENLLSRKYSEGAVVAGYQYNLSAHGDRFAAYADPMPSPGRHYFIDQTLDLRYDENGRATNTSPYLAYSKNQPQPSAPVENPAPSPKP